MWIGSVENDSNIRATLIQQIRNIRNRTMDFTTQVLVYCHKNNGGTFDFFRSGVCECGTGYFVARDKVSEQIYDRLTAGAIEGYVQAFDLDGPSDWYLGVWKYNDEWYLDVSLWFPRLKEALAYAREHDQLAIWSCYEKMEIKV